MTKHMKCKRCKHEWEYGGKKLSFVGNGIPLYIVCPKCKTTVKLD